MFFGIMFAEHLKVWGIVLMIIFALVFVYKSFGYHACLCLPIYRIQCKIHISQSLIVLKSTTRSHRFRLHLQHDKIELHSIAECNIKLHRNISMRIEEYNENSNQIIAGWKDGFHETIAKIGIKEKLSLHSRQIDDG